jgi:hypothetical protein
VVLEQEVIARRCRLGSGYDNDYDTLRRLEPEYVDAKPDRFVVVTNYLRDLLELHGGRLTELAVRG